MVPELIAAAKEISADLMVLGTHAPHGLDRLFFGSESEKTADESQWPVMIVGPKVPPAAPGGWAPKRILCVLQPAECSIAAAVFGVRLAQALGAQTTFLMVETEGEKITEEEREFAYTVTEELYGVDLNINRDIERVHISSQVLLEEVLDRTKKEQIGAIVMCAEVEGIMHTHGKQTVLSRLLSSAPCPVIVTGREYK